jgi:hypothetical protein
LATGRAKRARWRPPRRTRRGGRGARTTGTLATRVDDGPAARPAPAHARHRGPTPGWPVTTNSPRRHHAASGEGWNPTASRTMAILPAALGWHHAPPNPRRQAAGELGACYTTAARRRRRRTRATPTGRTRGDGLQHGGPTSRPDAPAPPPPNPHPSPNPAPGAALSTTLAGQGRTGVAAWAAMHTPDRPRPATGCIARPSRRRTLHFLSVPVNWDRRCGWFSHYRLSQFEGGRARKRGGLYLH